MRESFQKLIVAGIVSVVFLTGIITGAIAIDWYRHREPTSSDTAAHPPPEFGDSYKFQKQLWSQWHWTYGLKSSQGNDTGNWKIKQLCPTFKHDAKLVNGNGDLAAYSDGKIFAYDGSVTNPITKLIVKDSTGTPIYIVRSGDAIETIVNSNKIFVNLQIRDGNDELLLGFSTKWDWGFGSKTTVKDSNGDEQFTLERNKISVKEWVWNVKTKGNTLVDSRLVTMLIGKSSFSGSGDDKTDACNGAFHALYITSITLLSLVAFTLVIGGVVFYRHFVKKRRQYVSPGSKTTSIELSRLDSNDREYHRAGAYEGNLRDTHETFHGENERSETLQFGVSRDEPREDIALRSNLKDPSNHC